MLTMFEKNKIVQAILREKMLSKINKNIRWSYLPVYLPNNMSQNEIENNLKNFINNELDSAIKKCAEVLPFHTEEDSASIGTSHPTKNATQFLQLLDYLEGCGIPGPRTFSKPISFYTGREAQKKAYYTPSELSFIEGMIPASTVFYDLWYAVQKNPSPTLMFCSISRWIATFSHGTANVYLSSDDPSRSAGLIANSYLWNTELSILHYLYALPENHPERVSAIMIHLYDAKKQQWNEPIDFHSEKSALIPILIEKRGDEADHTSLGYMKNVVSIWKKVASESSAAPCSQKIQPKK